MERVIIGMKDIQGIFPYFYKQLEILNLSTGIKDLVELKI